METGIKDEMTMSMIKRCSRCDMPLDRYNQNTYQIELSFHESGKTSTMVSRLCKDCFEIVNFAASPDSCGNKSEIKRIQEFATNPPKRQKKNKVNT